MRQHVYGPAGMDRTDHYRRDDGAAAVAVGYGAIVDGEARDPNTNVMGLIGSPAGGGYSTVLDLVRFAAALGDGRLLAPERLERIWSPPGGGAESNRYGYLWGSGVEAGHRWVGHNGGGPGVSADFRYFPDSGYVVVVLSNVSEGAMPVSQWITDLVARGMDAPSAGPLGAAQDSAHVRAAALDYLEGWFTGDAERMARSLHPDLVKRRVVDDALSEQSRDDLTGMAAAMGGRTAPTGLAERVRILDLTDRSAVVRLDAPGWIDWLLLARIDGRWSIVQVLWETRSE
jgi:CubicO group peptidase (beta-lactamase class C family)